MSATASSFYITGGTVPPGTPSYVERLADKELYEALARGEFCYVLHARQMGKSSLMAHTTTRLREAGITVAYLDLTRLGQNLTVEQWYDGLLGHLGRQIDLEDELEEYWLAHERLSPLQRWLGALHEVVLARVTGPLVIAVDEIDTVRSLAFSTDEFFAAIRDCYNRRGQDPEFARLTFCLLGVATPSDLIQDTRTTPFNIGRRIELTDFTPTESAPLAAGLQRKGGVGAALLERVLYWTDGHPYLTQRLCQALAQDPNPKSKTQNPKSEVDRLCAELFLSPGAQEKDDNLLFVRERLLNSEADQAALLDLYGQVRAGKRVGLGDTNPLVDLLRLSGVVRAESGRLVVRNRIYGQVFDRQWVVEHMPDAELRRQRAAYRRGLVRATAIGATVAAVMLGLAVMAIRQKQRAEERLLRMNVDTGMRRAIDGDVLGALPWLAEAVRLAAGDPDQEKVQRLRFAAVLGQCPKLGQLWWVGQEVDRARFSLDGARAAFLTQPERNPIYRGAIAGAVGLVQMSTGRVRTLDQPPGAKTQDFALSPDGRRLVVRYDDRSARVWNALTGEPASPPFKAGLAPSRVWWSRLDLPQSSLVFSPDGHRIATVSDDGKARLWDAISGQPLLPPLPHDSAVGTIEDLQLQFSPDGRLLLTAGRETVRLWETETGRTVSTLRPGTAVHFAAFHPDSRRVLITSDAGLQLWDGKSGEPAGPLIPQPFRRGVTPRPSFSPDGRRVLVASPGETAGQVWNPETGALVSVPKQSGLDFSNAWLSPEGRRILTPASDGTLRVWAADWGAAVLPPLPHEAPILQAAFTPDGRRLLTFCRDGTVRVWETAPAAPRAVVLQHRPDTQNQPWDGIFRAVFSPDGRRVATASNDHTARVWDAATGQPVSPPLRHDDTVITVAFSPDGRRVATAGGDNTAKIWDAVSGKLLTPPLGHTGEGVFDAQFSPDGRRLVTAAFMVDAHGRMWDATTGRALSPWFTPPESDSGGLRALFSPDGRRILTTHMTAKALLRDARTGRLLAPPLQHQAYVYDAAFSPDGRRVVTASWDGTARVWDAITGRPLTPPLRHTRGVSSARFSPEGRRIVTGSLDGTARVWDAATGQPITPSMRHPADVQAVAYSPDGLAVATGTENGEAWLWDAATGQPITPPLKCARGFGVLSVALSRDGRRLLAAGRDGAARLWTLAADERAPGEIARLAQVLIGARLDATGSLTPLKPAALLREWQSLRARYPGDFQAARDELLAWHRQEAQAAEKAQAWEGAVQHLTPLIEAEPWNDELRLRRAWNDELRLRRAKAAAAAGQLARLPLQDALGWMDREAETSKTAGEWNIALAHLDRLVQIHPANGALRWRRARAYAALGQSKQALADYARAIEAEPHQEADHWYQETLQVTARVTGGKVRLTWQPLPLALGYQIYRGPGGASPGQLVRLTRRPVVGAAFVDPSAGLMTGQPRTYAVAPVLKGTAGQAVEGPPVRLPVTTVAGLPAWLGCSVNEGERSGSVRFQPATGEITLQGSGQDLWDQADGFYFLNQPVTGDFQITARALTRPTERHEWAKAGLIIRESLAAGARNGCLVITPRHGLHWQWRPSRDEGSLGANAEVLSHAGLRLPILLRLARRGNTITAAYSTDNGRSYRPADPPVTFESPLPATLYAGLAITAHDESRISEAKFRDLRIEPLHR